MSEFEWFIFMLESSAKKHGFDAINIYHLLNIAKLASRQFKCQELGNYTPEEMENLLLLFEESGFNPDF